MLALAQDRLRRSAAAQQRVDALSALQDALGLERCRCGSRASTSPTSAASTPSPRWSSSRAGRRRSRTTGGSTDPAAERAGGARTTLPRWRRCSARRAAQLLEQADRSPHDPERDESFAALPDLILIDGGKGQLSAGMRALGRWSSAATAVVGAGEAARGGLRPGPLRPARDRRPTPRRFACCSGSATRPTASRSTHHRGRRDKAMTASLLDDLPGRRPGPKAGPARALRLARPDRRPRAREEIEAVPGLPGKLAREIHRQLNKAG